MAASTTLTADELALIAQSPYKADFPLLADNPDLAFLDSAATSQRPRQVLDAQRRFYETMNANPCVASTASPSRPPRPSPTPAPTSRAPSEPSARTASPPQTTSSSRATRASR